MHKLKIEIFGKVQLSHNKVIADSPLCQISALTHDSSCTCRLLLARCDKDTNEIHCHRNTGHWTVETAYIQQKSFEIQHLLKCPIFIGNTFTFPLLAAALLRHKFKSFCSINEQRFTIFQIVKGIKIREDRRILRLGNEPQVKIFTMCFLLQMIIGYI